MSPWCGALRGACERLGVEIRHGLGATGLKTHDTHAEITLSDGSSIETRLVVACDGVRSHLRDARRHQDGALGLWPVRHRHHGRARAPAQWLRRRALPARRPLRHPAVEEQPVVAGLDRNGPRDANRLVRSDDLVFEEELERRFGHKLGALKVVGDKRAFPLGLTLARAFVAPRLALAGDAAHGIHPISGQGLNLGFKDVAALAETIVDADRLGLDIGSINILERYQAWRRFDTFRMGVTTDVLNRLFSNDLAPIRIARDFGLGIVDRLPGLKSYFIGQAAGTTATDNPRLLAGQTI
jgi:2-octaprenyl-6-methoxyphenol hydroxylase